MTHIQGVFFNFVMIKSSSNKKFHKTSKLDNVINDHHANFDIDDVTMGGARSFLRFYSMGRAGWGKKFGCQNFSLIILHPVIGRFFLVFPVLGHSGHSTMCLIITGWADSMLVRNHLPKLKENPPKLKTQVIGNVFF